MSRDWRVVPLIAGTSYSSSSTLLATAGLHVVVDTGLSLQESELLRALRTQGLAPGDIDLVVNTHLHVDHCMNNAVFPRADIYLSRAEWQWTSAFYAAVFASRAPEIAAIDFYPELPSHHLHPRTIRNAARMARFFWDPVRLGAEARFKWLEDHALPDGLVLLPTPGHTPHHVSIDVPAANVVVAGDAVLAEDLHAKVRTMIPFSREQFARTRESLLQTGRTIVPGHGPAFAPLSLGV